MSSSSSDFIPNHQYSSEVEIRVRNDIDLSSEVETVLRNMFGSFSQVAVESEFSRGFSGSRVFRVRLVEQGGKAHLPAVIKIAPVGLIRQEWQAYQNWVGHSLPNIARIEMSPTLPAGSSWGGLRYSLVGGGTFEVQSLHDYYQTAKIEDFCWVLENRLFEVMGSQWWLDSHTNRAFQMQADYDLLLPINLRIRPIVPSPQDDFQVIEANNNLSLNHIAVGNRVQLQGFVATRVEPKEQQLTLNLPSVLKNHLSASCQIRLYNVPDITRYQVGDIIDAIYGEVINTRHDFLIHQVRQALGQTFDPSAKRVRLTDTHTSLLPSFLPNPLLAYQKLLQDFITVKISTIHGDLNLENILVDPATREINLIDFATVRPGHNLRDLIQLETGIVVYLIPTALEKADLPAGIIYTFYERLHQAILQPDPALASGLPWPDLEKLFRILKSIRQMARKCLFNLDDWEEYYRGLLLCLLGTLKYRNLQALPTAPLPNQVAFWGAATALHLIEQPKAAPVRLPSVETPAEIESPYGTMPPTSRFYIERAADRHCWERIDSNQTATLFIQAPRQMGKSSLMRRAIEQARMQRQKRSVFIDFQRFPEQYFYDEENLLIELCLMIGDALNIPEAIDRYWQGRRTSIMKCSRYLSNYIIPELNEPLILAMDEVDRMLTSPFRSNFFGMLRTWHNDRVFDENFARLTLFLSSSTEPYLFIDNPSQSPFNVAEIFSLRDFTLEEVEVLNRRHHSPLTQDQVGQLMELLNGHPFLTRLSLYLLTTMKIADFETLLSQATEDNGPFGDHLRHYLLKVLQNQELKQALTYICRNRTYEENQIFYRLKGAGLIKKVRQQVVLRNNLYARYFEEHLNG